MKKGWLAVLAIIGLVVAAWVVNSPAYLDLDTAIHETVVLSDGPSGAAGVVIGPHTILTALHVVENEPNLKAETFDHRKINVSTTWTYAGGDFALVETKEDLGLPVARLSCNPMYVGEHVTAIGHPFLEIMWNVTEGYVSTLQPVRADTGLAQQSLLVGMNVTAAPGNSGGPVFNDHGNVVGLVDAGRGGAGTFSFAIPVSEICRTLPRLP